MGKSKLVTEDGECTFAKAEQAVWESNDLTITEKGFYQTLKSFRNRKSKQCFPSVRTICDRAGISKNSGYKCRGRLQALGIIEFTSERGRKHSCHYRFILEDGNSQEISMALSNLSQNKIAQNKDTENRRNEGQQIAQNKDNKIAQNKDTNQMNITRRREPHTEPGQTVCVSSVHLKEKTAIKKEDQDYINQVVAEGTQNGSIHNPGAYRAALEKKAMAGTMTPHDAPGKDVWERWQLSHKDEPPYYDEKHNVNYNEVQEAKLDKNDDAYKLTRLLFDLNVERNPTYRVPEFLHAEIKHFEKLLRTHKAKDIEMVLRYHHDNRRDMSLWDPYSFAFDFDNMYARTLKDREGNE